MNSDPSLNLARHNSESTSIKPIIFSPPTFFFRANARIVLSDFKMPKDTDVNSGYSTRKKQYMYSNTRAPYAPAPARDPIRPPLPPLASRRKQGKEYLVF